MSASSLIVPSWPSGVGQPIFAAIPELSLALGVHVMLSGPARVKPAAVYVTVGAPTGIASLPEF
jgi:hypothetical protein